MNTQALIQVGYRRRSGLKRTLLRLSLAVRVQWTGTRFCYAEPWSWDASS
jgi:hypothetical protein